MLSGVFCLFAGEGPLFLFCSHCRNTVAFLSRMLYNFLNEFLYCEIIKFRIREAIENMDGIDEILKAEKEAERILREAKEAAAAAEGSAEGYRSRTLEAARRQGEEEAAELLKAGEERARRRQEELKAIADVKNGELRARAEENLEKTAAWIARALSEV